MINGYSSKNYYASQIFNYLSYDGYFPSDLLFYIKDGKSVCKREKIFYNYNNSTNLTSGAYVSASNYGYPELYSLSYNSEANLQLYSNLYHGINGTTY
jgi:hypothetical protein